MSQTPTTSGRFRSVGPVIAILAVAFVVLAGGAFAFGRNTADHQVATRATYSQAVSADQGRMWSWMGNHDDDWMRAHVGDLAWMRHHATAWMWMRDHMDDVVWMQKHPGSLRWIQHRGAMHGWRRHFDTRSQQWSQMCPG